MENLYVVNANLTTFEKEISNAVPDLMDLNETDILKKIVNTTKLMREGETDVKEFQKYLESKVFGSDKDSTYFMIQNPYIETPMKSIAKKLSIFFCFLVFYPHN